MENFIIAVAATIIGGLSVGLILRYLNKEKDEKLKTGVTQINKNTASMQNIILNVNNLNITDPQVTKIIEQLNEGISSTASTAQSMATTLKINLLPIYKKYMAGEEGIVWGDYPKDADQIVNGISKKTGLERGLVLKMLDKLRSEEKI